MSIVQEILYTLSNYPGGYRAIYDIVYNSQPPGSGKVRSRRENTLRVTLSRLKKKKLIQKVGESWHILEEGKELLDLKGRGTRSFSDSLRTPKKVSRTLIVMFDIPESKKVYRDWLRSELIGFGFVSVQKSVWLGPPLPDEFVKYLNEANLLEYIRFFRAAEEDII